MQIIISVWHEDPYWQAGFVRGQAELCFATHREKEPVVERAANVAIEFDLDLHVMGQLADAYEIRDTR